MWRLFRTMLGLLTLNAVCIALVLLSRSADVAWDCVRFLASDHTSIGLLDVKHGASIIEQSLVPAAYRSQLTWLPISNGLAFYYEFTMPTGTRNLGIAGYGQTFNIADNGKSQGLTTSLYSISSDDHYIVLNTSNPKQRRQTLTIHDRATLTPLVSAMIDGNVSPKSTSDIFSRQSAPDWSASNEWFAFTSYTSTSLTLTLMSPSGKQAESVTLNGKNSLTRIIWSPTGTSLAILSGRSANRQAYANLDIVTLVNGHWQRVNSYDVNLDATSPLTWELADAVWDATGQTLTVLQGASVNEGLNISLLTFRSDHTAIPTITTLDANARPIALTPAWLCVQDAATRQYTLVPLSAAQSPVTLTTSCLSPYLSPDKARLLLKLPSSASSAATWAGLSVDPFSLTSLSLPVGLSDNLAWGSDHRYLIARIPAESINPNQIVGQIALIDTATWQWSLVPQKADLVLPATISPDSSRFTVWTESGDTLLLLDTDDHLLAELPIDTPYDFSVNVGWSPDSQYMLVSRIDNVGLTMISLFNRDGRVLKTFRQPAEFEMWLGGYLEPSWSRCEPSSKLRA